MQQFINMEHDLVRHWGPLNPLILDRFKSVKIHCPLPETLNFVLSVSSTHGYSVL